MIAACPKCSARYRIEPEKLRPEGVRLRCSNCEAVFRVRAPAPPPPPQVAPPALEEPAEGPAEAPFDPVRGVLLAVPDVDLAKRVAETLRGQGLHALVVHDGVEAMLEIQRKRPRAVVLAADLPKMFGFQVCEVVKRNESLRETLVILAGVIHHPNRYRRPPGEIYGADAYLEVPDLAEGLLPLLVRNGVPVATGPASAPSAPPAPSAPVENAPAPTGGDGLDDERSKAERLARIIVSDIILYNEEKFAAAITAGNVAQALEPDLAEGRGLFQERIAEPVRAERDHLVDELLRVARTRGMQ